MRDCLYIMIICIFANISELHPEMPKNTLIKDIRCINQPTIMVKAK